MPVPVSASSLLRALGVFVAALIPWSRTSRTSARITLLAGTDAAARQVDPGGITLVSVTPDEGETFGAAKAAGTTALPTASWTLLALVVLALADRLPGPRIVKAVLLGAGVYALDGAAARFGQRLAASAEEAAERASG